MSELKKCPFCGSKDAVKLVTIPGKDGFRDNYCVRCDWDSGGCGAEGGWRHYQYSAKEAWNYRYRKNNRKKFERNLDRTLDAAPITSSVMPLNIQSLSNAGIKFQPLSNVEMNDGTDSTTGGTAPSGLDGR